MSLTVQTQTSDTFNATVTATFSGPGSDAALLAVASALNILEQAGNSSASAIRDAAHAECQRRGLLVGQAITEAQAALLAHLTA